jgi:hypothetical protein
VSVTLIGEARYHRHCRQTLPVSSALSSATPACIVGTVFYDAAFIVSTCRYLAVDGVRYKEVVAVK